MGVTWIEPNSFGEVGNGLIVLAVEAESSSPAQVCDGVVVIKPDVFSAVVYGFLVLAFHEVSVGSVEISLDGIRTFRSKPDGFGEISEGMVVITFLAIGLASVKENGRIGTV